MNRKEFVETFLEARETLNMLDKKDRNIYAFLDLFGRLYTDKYHFSINFNVKDYDESELDLDTVEFIRNIENNFYVTKLNEIYHECLDMHGDDITINKFTVYYFEKRNKFIDKIVDIMEDIGNDQSANTGITEITETTSF